VLSDSAVGTTTYQYDKNDRLFRETGATNATYTYDNNGNTKSVTQAGQTTTYTWDNRNRMVQVQSPTGTTQYTYNDENIRTSSRVGTQTTQFLLDGNRDYSQVLAESKGGTVQASYVYGLDLVSQKRGTAESFYLVDGLGSTRGLTDAAGGLTDSYTYDAFGNLVGSAGSTSNSYLFAGEQLDAATGDYYLRQRFYDAGTGRFTRRDSYEGNTFEPITLNKYVYGNGNPANYTDPSGLFSYAEASAGTSLGGILLGIAGIGYYVNNIYDPEPLGGFGAGGGPSVSDHTGHKPQDSVLSKILGLRGFNDDKRLDVGANHTGHSPDDSLRWLISHIFSIDNRSPEEISYDIAYGHTWVKHQRDWRALNLTTQEQLAHFIEDIIIFTENTKNGSPSKSRDRKAYWDERTEIIVILNPSEFDGDTAFHPDTGREYFDEWE
jgi:RHS repeat-associated protein